MRSFASRAELDAAVGQELGVSSWTAVDQERIAGFADVTGDHQWIHVDVDRAASGPYGAPIAHGYLTLALLPLFRAEIFDITGTRLSLNYGLNKVRFPGVVRSGARVRGRATLLDVVHRGEDTGDVVVRYEVEVEGAAKPVCVAESVVRVVFDT